MSHITDVVVLCDPDDVGELEREIGKDCGYRSVAYLGHCGIMFECNHLDDEQLAKTIARVCPRGARVIVRDEYGDGWKVLEWQLAMDSDFDVHGLYDRDWYRSEHEEEHCAMLTQLRRAVSEAKELREKKPTANEDTLRVMAESLGIDEKKFMREAVSLVARDSVLRGRLEANVGKDGMRVIKARFPKLGW